MKRHKSAEVKRNIELEITGIGSQGEGIAAFGEELVYIPFTAKGDRIIANIERQGKSAWRGNLVSVLQASDQRRTPLCQHFSDCGGCSMQHISPLAYEEWIKERLSSTFAHHGIFETSIMPARISPERSRRRLQLEAVQAGGRVLLGLHGRKQHKIVDLKECPVSVDPLVALFQPLRQLLSHFLNAGQKSRIHLNSTDTGVSAMIELPQDPDLEGREKLAAFSRAEDLAELTISIGGYPELVARHREAVLTFGRFKVSLPVNGFMQATEHGQSALQEVVRNNVKKGEYVADLFSGMGTFTLPILTSAKAHAVDGDAKLLKALEMSANALPGRQLTTEHRDLFRRPLLADELNSFNTVIIDPPRAGAKEQFYELAKSNISRIIGISCNPNTFARDAKILIDGGYQIGDIVPIDQFLWSHNLEIATVFTRR